MTRVAWRLWNLPAIVAGCLVVCSAWASPAWPSEADNWTHRYSPMGDSLAILNDLVNRDMRAAVDSANSRGPGCSSERLYRRVRKTFIRFGISKFEGMIKKNKEIDQYPIGKESPYQDFRFLSHHPSILGLRSLQAPLLRVGGIPVGADKFSHFFTEGWHYFKRADLQGRGLEAALEFGRKRESGFWGKITTGVYSYADLLSNYQGLLFWRRILGGQAPYVVCREDQWVLEQSIDWMDYIDQGWDEGNNCNDFRARKMEECFNRRIDALEERSGRPMTCPIRPAECSSLKEAYGSLAVELLHPRCLGDDLRAKGGSGPRTTGSAESRDTRVDPGPSPE